MTVPIPVAPALTDKQAEVFHCLVSFTIEHLYQPSLREIADHFGFSSPNSVKAHLRSLKAKGFIDFDVKQSRSIRILRKPTISVHMNR